MVVASLDSRRYRSVIGMLVFVALLAAASAVHAQDANYWTLQHGNQARLLGGAVVGGAEDLSATYYNPARLAMITSKELILAGNVFDYTSLSVDGAVEGKEFTSARLAGVPSLFAGHIGSLSDDRSHWAYSLLARYNTQFRIDERRNFDTLTDYETDQTSASFTFDEYLSEYWAGLTWSRSLSESFAVGVTGYVAVRNQSSRSLIVAQAARVDTVGLAIQRRDFSYTHVSVLAKIGVSGNVGDWKLGLTATTGNLRVFGNGTLGFDESFVADDLDGDGETDGQMISSYQDKLTATHHAAPSLSAGVTYDWTNSSLHLTSEWFAAVDRYTVLEAEPIVSSDGSQERNPELSDTRDAVLNFGVGFEHRFHEQLRGYASLRTDFTSVETVDSSQIAFSIWDIYHLGAGATFRALNTDITLGMIYAFGGAEAPPSFSLIPEGDDPDDSAIDQYSQNLKYRYRRLTGLIGFSFGF